MTITPETVNLVGTSVLALSATITVATLSAFICICLWKGIRDAWKD